jgi:transcriptional regulator with XRE-family HTH domain
VPHRSSTVASWELASRLRQRRLALRLDVESIATEFAFSRAYWSAVENGKTMLAESRFREALDLLEFDDQEKQELNELRTVAKGTRWWEEYSDILHGDVLRMLGFEYGAHRIRSYESALVTGLLQTPDYAREVIELDIGNRPADSNRRLELRQRRREQLFAADDITLSVVMSEAALRQCMGTTEALRGQLQFLAEIADTRPETVEIRIQPFEKPPRGVAGSSTFYLFDFETAGLPTVAWQEAILPIGLTEKKKETQFLSVCFDQVVDASLDRERSLDLIRQYIAELS